MFNLIHLFLDTSPQHGVHLDVVYFLDIVVIDDDVFNFFWHIFSNILGNEPNVIFDNVFRFLLNHFEGFRFDVLDDVRKVLINVVDVIFQFLI